MKQQVCTEKLENYKQPGRQRSLSDAKLVHCEEKPFYAQKVKDAVQDIDYMFPCECSEEENW